VDECKPLSGGILPLPDVFCLFNRARGSELISPEDLLKACQLWAKLRIPLTFRRFDSGVTVVGPGRWAADPPTMET
jgi:ESCRT-II complex subunit VPS36